MLRLENPIYLYLLILIPFLIVVYIYLRLRRKKLLNKFGDVALISRLYPDVSNYKHIIRLSLLLSALLFIIVGIANPQLGTKIEEFKREGVDVIIAIDVSNSMKADDIKPDRLERAKQYVSRLIDKLQNDRIGLIVFAGDAYLQLPLTTDFSAAKLFLSAVNTDMVEEQGTAIGSAIQLAIKSFQGNDPKHKALIIITDGENHEDDAVSAATEAAKQGIIIHTIGMGSINGSPIPIYNNGFRSGFMKDNEGNVVVSKLDPAMLQQIASAGGGKFIRSTGDDPDLSSLLDELSGMKKKEYSSKLFTDYVDWFHYFIGFALIILVVEIFISDRKNKFLTSLNLFGEKKL